MAILVTLLLFACAAANYLLHRDVVYPGFLQAVLWAVATALFLVNQNTFIPVPDRVFLIFFAGVVLFGLGAFLGSAGHRPQLARNYVRAGTLPWGPAIVALALVTTVGLFLYVERAQDLASSGPSTNVFVNLRLAVSDYQAETGGFGIVQYFVMLANVLMAIVILRRHGEPSPTSPRTVVTLVVLVALTFGVLTSGRGPVLAVLVIGLAIPTVLRVVRPTATALRLGLVAVVLFGVVGLALGKGGDLGSTVSENWATMRESLVVYSVGGIPALGTFLDQRGPDLEWGANAFRTVLVVLRTLGFETPTAPLVQAFVDIPMPFNVYTIYHPYVRDFGVGGAILVQFVLGVVHGLLYRKATVKHPHALSVFLFACSLFPLAMQVFQDMYFSLLSLWIQYVAYALLFFVVLAQSGMTPLTRAAAAPA